MGIVRGRVDSIEDFEKQFEKKSGDGQAFWPTRLGKNGKNSLSVRFLTEPDQWVWYQQYWDQALGRTVIATEENEEDYKERGLRPSTVYLAPAILVENNQIIVLELRWTLAESVKAVREKYQEKFGPLTSYDVELKKTGTTKDDTKYFAMWDGAANIDVDSKVIPNGHKTWQDFLWSVAEKLVDNGQATPATAAASLPDDTDLGEDNTEDAAEATTPRRVIKKRV